MSWCPSDAGKSSRGRGRRSAATGRSTDRSSRSRGHRMGSQNHPTAFGEIVQQSEVHDSAVNHDFNPFSRMPNLPAALRHQLNWISVNAAECSVFSFQKTANQHILKDCCKHFIDNFRQRCSHKLHLHSLEASEVNLFSLLIGSTFDSMLEYTTESMSILFPQTDNENNTEQQDDIVRDPTTLQSRLDQITWPTGFKLNKFWLLLPCQVFGKLLKKCQN
jgi:hypothetical protein